MKTQNVLAAIGLILACALPVQASVPIKDLTVVEEKGQPKDQKLSYYYHGNHGYHGWYHGYHGWYHGYHGHHGHHGHHGYHGHHGHHGHHRSGVGASADHAQLPVPQQSLK